MTCGEERSQYAQRGGGDSGERPTHFFIEADHLVVSTPMTALANHAFAHTVQARELDMIKLPAFVLVALLQIPQTLFEADKLALKHICLVNFIGNHDQLLLRRKLQNCLNVLRFE